MADQINRNAEANFNRTDGNKIMPSQDLDKSQRSGRSEQNELGKKSTGSDQWQRNEKGNPGNKSFNR